MTRRAFISLTLLPLASGSAIGQLAQSHRRIAAPAVSAGLIEDSMESYSVGPIVNGLNGGTYPGPYVDRVKATPPAMIDHDTMEQYTVSAGLNGLDYGMGWTGPYVDKVNPKGIYARDSMESYTVSAALNGLNGGDVFLGRLTWTGAYVDKAK